MQSSRTNPTAPDPASSGRPRFERVVIGAGEAGAGTLLGAASVIVPGAHLTLAKVYPSFDGEGGDRDGARSEFAARRALDELLREQVQAPGDRDLVAVRALPDDSAGQGLLRLARDGDADLLIIGQASHGVAGRLLLGDTGHTVLNAPPCSVLVVPMTDAVPAPPEVIGVAYSGKTDSLDALVLGLRLADDLGARLEILEVVPEDSAAGDGDEDRIDRAQRELDELRAVREGQAHGTALRGRPGEVLGDLARRVDLLVCGTAGATSPWARLLPGTAERLSHAENVSVLAVPPGAVRRLATPS